MLPEERKLPTDSTPPSRSDIPDEFRDDLPTQTQRPATAKSDIATEKNFPPPVGRQFSDFWALAGCNAIVFGTSVCIMILELTASRLIAPHVGMSLYTWTSVIGVVLAGISIGNYLGGWLADKYPAQKVLAWLFLISGLLTFCVLFLNGWAAATDRPEGTSWPVWVIFVVAWIFFLPALSLGTISPVTASIALKRSVKTGITVGNIYAWGALGSIVGTFLAGFWLIGEFGSRQVICGTSCTLVFMGVLVAGGQKAFRAAAFFGAIPLIIQFGLIGSATEKGMAQNAAWIAGIRSGWSATPEMIEADEVELAAAEFNSDPAKVEALQARAEWRDERAKAEKGWEIWGSRLGRQLHALGLTLALRQDQPGDYNDESDYYAINIANVWDSGDQVKQLRLDYLTHSYYNPQQPAKLHYTYEKVYAGITMRAAEYWVRSTSLAAEDVPDAGINKFCRNLAYDAETKSLAARGPVSFDDIRHLLSLGPYAEYWQAVMAAYEDAAEMSNARRRDLVFAPLAGLPDGVEVPADLAVAVHYDSTLKALVASRSFSDDDLWRLLSLGRYSRFIAAAREIYEKSNRTSTLFIGGGGFIFPRWIETVFPQKPHIDVAEIDPAVLKANELQLGLPREFGSPDDGKTWIRTHIGDARKFVDDQRAANRKLVAAGKPPVLYDFVYGDAFNDLSVPWHLTTREFSQKVRDLMTPGQGVFLVNIIDVYPRAEYPDKTDVVGLAEVPFPGKLPAQLSPTERLSEDFVPCRGGFVGLEVAQRQGSLVLKYKGVMTSQIRKSLEKLDRAGDSRSESGPFTKTVKELFRESNSRTRLTGSPPAAITPTEMSGNAWRNAPKPFVGLQVMGTPDIDFALGCRGVISTELQISLKALPDATDEFKRAIDLLAKRSRDEQVGKFLGRYCATARQIFPYIYVFTSNEGEPDEDRDTFIIACSLRKLSFENLITSGGHWKNGPFAWTEADEQGEPQDQGEMPVILQLARGLTLTDDFAPVDNLLAPVFVRRSSD